MEKRRREEAERDEKGPKTFRRKEKREKTVRISYGYPQTEEAPVSASQELGRQVCAIQLVALAKVWILTV